MVSAQAVEPVAAVLVVDDSEPRRATIRAMLAPLGHNVIEAASGEAALTAVEQESFAVILIAVRAPASYAIAGRLRDETRSATTPIIFIAEDAPDEDDSDAAYAGGPVDFMSAPLRANMLQSKVWTFVALYLQGQQLWRSRQSISGLSVALNASEVRARTVLEHVADGIVTTSEGGLIESFNASAQRLFGYSEDEILGQPFQLVLAPSHRDGFFYPGYAMWMLPSAGEPATQRLESEGARKNGSCFPIELDLSLMQIQDRTLTVFCIRDISGRKAHTDALEHRALHDDLTGLPNRTLFCDRIDRTLASAGRASESRALLVVDLNRFREFNATHGREQGDAVLREVAGRLRAAIRDWHTVARLGDDEFGILPSTPTGVVEASVIAWNVRQAFERPFLIGNEEVSLDASIGVAFYPQHGRSTVDLLRRAELAMHQAKRAGSGLTVFVSDPADQTARRMSLLNELRDAIPKGELVLHFQPKVDLTGELRTTGVEALVRWQHPTEGLLMPDRFIPEAECTELIEPLTNWVLDAALGQLRAWQDEGLELSVAVNVSAHSLTPGSGLPAMVASLSEKWDIAPERLVLELTETSILDPEVPGVLERLHEMGEVLAIDDFGTGHSSLVYLQRLPIDEIKVDRSFVMNLATDSADAVIVRSTIDLAHNLGLKVVAEGVEDEISLQRLIEYGCDSAQGYYFSRPRSADDLKHWLTGSRFAATAVS